MGKTKLGRFQVPVLSTNDNDMGKAIDARTGSPFSVGSGSGGPVTNTYVVGTDEGFEYGTEWSQTVPDPARVRVMQTGRDIRFVGRAIMPDTTDILECLQEQAIVSVPSAWTLGMVSSPSDGSLGVAYWALYRPSGQITLATGVWLVQMFSEAQGGSGIWWGFTDDAEVAELQALREPGDELWISFLYAYPFLITNDPDA